MITTKDKTIILSSVFKKEEGVVTQVMGEVYSDRKKWKKVMMEINPKQKDGLN